MIRWLCPYCGRRLKAPESAIGRSGKCPTCRNRITVPPFSTFSGESERASEAAVSTAETVFRQENEQPPDDAARAFLEHVAEVSEATPAERDLPREPTAVTARPESEIAETSSGPASLFVTISVGGEEEEEATASKQPVSVGEPGEPEEPRIDTPVRPHAWQRHQYRVLALSIGISCLIALCAEIALVELGRGLAGGAEGSPEALLSTGLWQGILLAGGILVLLASYACGLAAWLAADASRRRCSVAGAVTLALVGNILGCAIYLATRPLVSGEVREGGLGWNLCRYLAALWVLWLVYAAAILVGVLLWSLVRGLPFVLLLSGSLVSYLPQLVLWPLVCLAFLGYLLRLNSVVEVG